MPVNPSTNMKASRIIPDMYRKLSIPWFTIYSNPW